MTTHRQKYHGGMINPDELQQTALLQEVAQESLTGIEAGNQAGVTTSPKLIFGKSWLRESDVKKSEGGWSQLEEFMQNTGQAVVGTLNVQKGVDKFQEEADDLLLNDVASAAQDQMTSWLDQQKQDAKELMDRSGLGLIEDLFVPKDKDGEPQFSLLPQLDQLSLFWGIDKAKLRELTPDRLSELIEEMPIHWNPKKQKAALIKLYNEKTSGPSTPDAEGMLKYLNDKLITKSGAKKLKTTLLGLDGAYLDYTKQFAQSMIVATINRLSNDSSYTAQESEDLLNNLIEAINFYDPELFTHGDYQNLVQQRAEEGVKDVAQARSYELTNTLNAWISEGVPNLLLENIVKAIQTGNWNALGITSEEADEQGLSFDTITTEQILDLLMPKIMSTREDESDVGTDIMLEEAKWLLDIPNYADLKIILEKANLTVAHDVILELAIRQKMKVPIQSAIDGVHDQIDIARLKTKIGFVNENNAIASNPMRPIPTESLVWDMTKEPTFDIYKKRIDKVVTDQASVLINRFSYFMTDWAIGGKQGGWGTIENFLLKDQAIDELELADQLAKKLITPEEYKEAISQDLDYEQGLHTDRFLDHHFRPAIEAKWSHLQDKKLREQAINNDLLKIKRQFRTQTLNFMDAEVQAEADNHIAKITSGLIQMSGLNPIETSRKLGTAFLQMNADLIDYRKTLLFNYPYDVDSPLGDDKYIDSDIQLVVPPDSLPADSPLRNHLFILENTDLHFPFDITYEAVPTTDPLYDTINKLYGAVAQRIQRDTDPNAVSTGLPYTSLINGNFSTKQVQNTMVNTHALMNQVKQYDTLLAQNPPPHEKKKIQDAMIVAQQAIESNEQVMATGYNNSFTGIPNSILEEIANPAVYNDPDALWSRIGWLYSSNANGKLNTNTNTRDRIITAAKINNPFVGYLLENLDSQWAFNPNKPHMPGVSTPDIETQRTETIQDAITFALRASTPSQHLDDLQIMMETSLNSKTMPVDTTLTALNITDTPLAKVKMVFDSIAYATGDAPGHDEYEVIGLDGTIITGAGGFWFDYDTWSEQLAGGFITASTIGTTAFMQEMLNEMMVLTANKNYGAFMEWDQDTANKVAHHALYNLTKHQGWFIHRTPQEGGGQPYGVGSERGYSREGEAFQFIHDPRNDLGQNLTAVSKTFMEQHQTPIPPVYDTNDPLYTTIDKHDVFNLFNTDSIPAIQNYIYNFMDAYDFEYEEIWKITDLSILDNITTGPLSESWIANPEIRQMRADYKTMDPELFREIHTNTLISLDYDTLGIPGTIHDSTGDWIYSNYEGMKPAYYNKDLYGNNAMRDVSTIPELIDTYYSITGEFPEAEFYNRDFYNLTEWDIMIYAINKAHRGKIDKQYGDFGIDSNMIFFRPDTLYLSNAQFYEGIHFPPPGQDPENLTSRSWAKHREGFPLVLDLRNRYNQPLKDSHGNQFQPIHVTRKIVTALYGGLPTAKDIKTPLWRANGRRNQMPFSIPTQNPNPPRAAILSTIMNPTILNQAKVFDFKNNVGKRIMFQRGPERYEQIGDDWEGTGEWITDRIVGDFPHADKLTESRRRPYDLFVIPDTIDPNNLKKDSGRLPIVDPDSDAQLTWVWDGDRIWIESRIDDAAAGAIRISYYYPKSLVSPFIINELNLE